MRRPLQARRSEPARPAPPVQRRAARHQQQHYDDEDEYAFSDEEGGEEHDLPAASDPFWQPVVPQTGPPSKGGGGGKGGLEMVPLDDQHAADLPDAGVAMAVATPVDPDDLEAGEVIEDAHPLEDDMTQEEIHEYNLRMGTAGFNRANLLKDPLAVHNLGLDAQAAFRRRCYTLFTLQLSCVVAIQVYLLHTQAGRDLTLDTLRDNSFTLGVLALFMITAVVLYCSKNVAWWNQVVMCVFTGVQGVALSAMAVGYDRRNNNVPKHAPGMIQIFMYLAVTSAITIFTSQMRTQERDEDGNPTGRTRLVSMQWAGFLGFVAATIGAVALNSWSGWATGGAGGGITQGNVFGMVFSLVIALMMNTWFSYDAEVMMCKLAEGEYTQCIVMFYTDMLLLIGFLVLLCFMCCFGGDAGAGVDGGGGVGGGAGMATA